MEPERAEKSRGERPRDERPTPVGDAGKRATRRTRFIVGAFALLGAAIIASVVGYRSLTKTPSAIREIGIPEPYARAIVADVNGDGVEDMILVTRVDRGSSGARAADGRFEAFVQAIDGKSGELLFSLEQGPAYTSGALDDKAPPRIVLVASAHRLGVARVGAVGNARITIHELATGAEVKTLPLESSSGRACENRGGPSSPRGTFFFERRSSTSGTVIDLEKATKVAATASTCGEVATANVADVPADAITDRDVWSPRFSHETTLRRGAGPYGGREIAVLTSGLGFLVVDRTSTEDGDAGPRATSDVVGLDVAAGKTLFERSLASLGFTTERVDRIEGTDVGPLLFFSRGSARSAGLALVALLDPERGDKKWSLALPEGDRLSSYTLSKDRVYLKTASRILVVDLASGSEIRSVPPRT